MLERHLGRPVRQTDRIVSLDVHRGFAVLGILVMNAGIAPVPNGLWMRRAARNLIDDFSGFLTGSVPSRDPRKRVPRCSREVRGSRCTE